MWCSWKQGPFHIPHIPIHSLDMAATIPCIAHVPFHDLRLGITPLIGLSSAESVAALQHPCGHFFKQPSYPPTFPSHFSLSVRWSRAMKQSKDWKILSTLNQRHLSYLVGESKPVSRIHRTILDKIFQTQFWLGKSRNRLSLSLPLFLFFILLHLFLKTTKNAKPAQIEVLLVIEV